MISYLFSDLIAPCGKCGKWEKGCRNGCQAYAEFESSKKGKYERREKLRIERDAMRDMSNKKKFKPDTSASAYTRARRKNGL